jgi:ATP-binding cassette subfamily B protein
MPVEPPPSELQPPEPRPPDRQRSVARRRLMAPEVIQTSAMDCGPAALKCLLEGFGVPVSYGRLREACQTSVDGTSIDTLENVARLLGLDAEQIMVPAEHVVSPGADVLPAIAVIRLPSGMSHFVVLWRRIGPYLQVMDPARGRRWVRTSALLGDLYLHTQVVDSAPFRSFVTESGFTTPLEQRIRRLVGRTRASAFASLLRIAASDASWKPVVRWDGAVRAVEALIATGAVHRGDEADHVLRVLGTAAAPDRSFADVLAAHSCARADPEANGDDASPRFRGAVLVRVAGLLAKTPHADAEPLPRELAAALGEHRKPFWRSLTALWSPGARKLGGLAAGLPFLAAVGGIAEILIARPLLSAPANAAAVGRRSPAFGLAALGAVVLGLFAIELSLALATHRLGRALDQGLRRAFLRKLPLLGDRYFSSRSVSDMAERAHLLHRVRLLPGLISELGRCWLQMALMTAAIVWLYPRGGPIALGLFAFTSVVPLLGVPVLAERDLRLRTHSGSLMRFYLDGLLGLSAVRTHRAERTVAREHDARLAEWRRAGRDMVRASLTVEAAVVLVSALGASVLVIGSFNAPSIQGPGTGTGTSLLLLFLALGLPTQAARLISLWRQLPDHRNVTLRLIEPLGAPNEHRVREVSVDTEDRSTTTRAAKPATTTASRTTEAATTTGTPTATTAGIRTATPTAATTVATTRTAAAEVVMDGITVDVGGHPVLTDVSVTIAPGGHVAVVGASGAGKSTLLGLLLGLHVPVAGRVLVDGEDLNGDSDCLMSLRAGTAWVDPGVQLWNRSLVDNVAYGADAIPSEHDLTQALTDAELVDLSARLPFGAQTLLGEGGGLLSGGEGQRVRLARELVRVPRPRLVLLDEPFRGLDGETRKRLFARVRTRWTDATLIAATHDIALTRQFPRVLVVDAGRVIEDGDPNQLAAELGSHYRALLDAEARVRVSRWGSSRWRHWNVRDARVFAERP